MKNLLTILLIIVGYSATAQVEAPPPPPPPPAPQKYDREVFKVVEDMPRFPGCEEMEGSSKEKETCAKEALVNYIAENLVYPEKAKSENVTGMAVVQFIVKKDGTLSDIKTVRDPGSGTGKAAADVIHKMNTDGIKWIPGKQRGRLVEVQYTLPVKFKL